jgi:hypothetical protein
VVFESVASEPSLEVVEYSLFASSFLEFQKNIDPMYTKNISNAYEMVDVSICQLHHQPPA